MSAITPPEREVSHREAIALPLLRPVPKPSVPSATPTSVPPSGSPPPVQNVQKLNLDLLTEGHKVVIRTSNSTYNFEMLGDLRCKVIPGKPSARSGHAVLRGGLNADATEYLPNRILVGGRAAYQFDDEETAILTSVIESIFWVATKNPSPA